jgi:hypothetical protein
LNGSVPENVSDLGPEAFSAMLKIGAVGLKVPGPNVLSTPSPEILLRYLKSVGTHLSEGALRRSQTGRE